MIPLLVGGAALGLAKGYQDQQNEKKDRQVASATARYSPWTGMQPQQVKRGDMIGSGMQGAMAGGMLGQSLGGGGDAAAGGAMQTTDPAAQASMTGGQSMMQPGMAQKYPWMAM